MTAFTPAVSAATPELAMLAAFGKVTLAPVQLDGTLRSGLSVDATNASRLEGAQRAEAKRQAAYEAALAAEIAREQATPVMAEVSDEIELVEGETLVADLREEGTLVECAGDVAEVVAIIEDAKGTWVRIELSECPNEPLDIPLVDWQGEFGVEGESAILGAWDRVEVARMRRELIAA